MTDLDALSGTQKIIVKSAEALNVIEVLSRVQNIIITPMTPVLPGEQRISVRAKNAPDVISVRSRTQKIIIKPLNSSGSVNVVKAGPVGPAGSSGPQGPEGPQGEQGEPGVSGGASQSFSFEQADPSDTWEINHNLGFHPNVTVTDSGGTQVEGLVTYIDLNNLSVSFTVEFGGKAYLS